MSHLLSFLIMKINMPDAMMADAMIEWPSKWHTTKLQYF